MKKTSLLLGLVLFAITSSPLLRADVIPLPTSVGTFADHACFGGCLTTVTDPNGGYVAVNSSASGPNYSSSASAQTFYWGGDLYAKATETDGSYAEAVARMDGGWSVVLPTCANPQIVGGQWWCGNSMIVHFYGHPTSNPGISNVGDASGYGSILFGSQYGSFGSFALTGQEQEWDFRMDLVGFFQQSNLFSFSAQIVALAGVNGGAGTSVIDYSHTFQMNADIVDINGNVIQHIDPGAMASVPELGSLVLSGGALLGFVGLVRRKLSR